ncbi:hypothetical protein AAVH_40012, partial [Aphelenchoides avenae]
RLRHPQRLRRRPLQLRPQLLRRPRLLRRQLLLRRRPLPRRRRLCAEAAAVQEPVVHEGDAADLPEELRLLHA